MGQRFMLRGNIDDLAFMPNAPRLNRRGNPAGVSGIPQDIPVSRSSQERVDRHPKMIRHLLRKACVEPCIRIGTEGFRAVGDTGTTGIRVDDSRLQKCIPRNAPNLGTRQRHIVLAVIVQSNGPRHPMAVKVHVLQPITNRSPLSVPAAAARNSSASAESMPAAASTPSQAMPPTSVPAGTTRPPSRTVLDPSMRSFHPSETDKRRTASDSSKASGNFLARTHSPIRHDDLQTPNSAPDRSGHLLFRRIGSKGHVRVDASPAPTARKSRLAQRCEMGVLPMKHARFAQVLAACSAALGFYCPDSFAAESPKLELKDGERILFMGDTFFEREGDY
ncbi:hypothetical protein DAPPUDRAFT_273802, partial [Daphnia pulex]